jgi:membrane protein DedA with SNARE-associated domain
MDWNTLAQLVRIAIYTVGSFFLGQAVADGELFQAAIAGIINVGAFAWWVVFEKNRIAPAP